MKGRKTVVMIMVDALRHDYVTADKTPFLYSKSTAALYGELIPSFGFEPDAAYIAGLTPEQSNGGFQFWMNGDKLFINTRLFKFVYMYSPKILKIIIRKSIRFFSQKKASFPLWREMAHSANIPLEFLDKFSMPLKFFIHDEYFLESDSLFDILRKHNKTFFVNAYPEHKVASSKVKARVVSECNEHHDFVFLFLSDIDKLGHIYGPSSKEVSKKLTEIDREIQEIYNNIYEYSDDVSLIVFGDHGMEDVDSSFSMDYIVKNTNVFDLNKDTYFFDSVYARFWIKNKDRKRLLIEDLNKLDFGRVISRELKNKYHLNYEHNHFGDVIFQLNPKCVIAPSFYGDTPPKGMHGYNESCRNNNSFFLLNSKSAKGMGRREGAIDMRSIYISTLDELGFDTTTMCKELGIDGLYDD